jgi:hypothetical protein
MDKTKIDGYGAVLRFVTPLLIVLILFILNGLRSDINTVRLEATANFSRLEGTARVNFENLDKQFGNHLAHHQLFDKEIFERLTAIETIIGKRK